MKSLISSGLSVLLLSALSATAAHATSTRIEYQMNLTNHPVPVTSPAPVQRTMTADQSIGKTESPQAEKQPEQSQNSSNQHTRPLWDTMKQTILPIDY
jgi:hypothetical protein